MHSADSSAGTNSLIFYFLQGVRELHKALVLGILFTLLFSTFAVLPGGVQGAEVQTRATPPTPDLSTLTEKYNYSCDAAPSSTFTLVNTTHARYSFVTLDVRNALKANASFDSSTQLFERVALSLPSNPGVSTVEGYFYVPGDSVGRQTTSVGQRLSISLGGGGAAQLNFVATPGANDYISIYNGSSTFYVDKEIPRIPRDTWVHFILSVDLTDTTMSFYVYLASGDYVLSTTVVRPVGTVTYGYYNLRAEFLGYHLSTYMYIDDLHYYVEPYSLYEYIPQSDNEILYYKGWDWKSHIWVWERVYNGSGDHTDSRHYITIFEYAQNFTLEKASVVIANAADVNTTLNNTYLKNAEITFVVGLPDNATADAISWAYAHNSRVKAVVLNDYSSAILNGIHTLSDYETATQHLKKYGDIPVYGVVYCSNYAELNSSAWALLDGASIWGWYGHDYASNIDDAVSYIQTLNKRIRVGMYTHFFGDRTIKYAVTATASVQRVILSKLHDLIVQGTIEGIDVLGPARYLNYRDDDIIDTNEYFYHNEEAERYFAQLMSLSYDSTGTRITVSKEWDGKYVSFEKLQVPKLAQSTKYTIIAKTKATVELMIPPNWDYNAVIVRDITTGQQVSWKKGSVIFTTVANHTYTVEELIQTSFEISINWTYALVGTMISLMAITVMMNFLSDFMQGIRKAMRFGHRK